MSRKTLKERLSDPNRPVLRIRDNFGEPVVILPVWPGDFMGDEITKLAFGGIVYRGTANRRTAYYEGSKH